MCCDFFPIFLFINIFLWFRDLPCSEWLQEAHEAFDCHFPSDITNLIKSYIYIPKKFGGEIVQRKSIPLVSFLVPLPGGELAFSSDRTVHYWSRDLTEISKRSFEETIIHLVHLQARVVVIAFRFHLAFVDLDDGPQGKVLGQMSIRVPPEPEPDAKYVSPFHRIEEPSVKETSPAAFWRDPIVENEDGDGHELDLTGCKPAVSVWRVLPLLDGRLAVALNTGLVQVFTQRAGESWWSRRPHCWVTFNTRIQSMVGFEQLECGTVLAYSHADRGMAYYDCMEWKRMRTRTEDAEGAKVNLLPWQTQALLKISHSRLVSFSRHGLSCWSVPAQRRVGGRFVSRTHIYEPLALWHDNVLICGAWFPHKLVLRGNFDNWDDYFNFKKHDHEFLMEREVVCAMMDRLGRFVVCTDRELMIME